MISADDLARDFLNKRIARDLGQKAGTDAVAVIRRTMNIAPDPVVKLTTAVLAAQHVLAIPLAIMMSRRGKTPAEVVEGLFEMMRPGLIGAITDTRAAFADRAPETAPPPPVERGAPPVHPCNPGSGPRPHPARRPGAQGMKPLSPVVRARLQAACDVVAPRQNSNPAVAARTLELLQRDHRATVRFSPSTNTLRCAGVSATCTWSRDNGLVTAWLKNARYRLAVAEHQERADA